MTKKIVSTVADKDEHGNIWLITLYDDATYDKEMMYERKEFILENYLNDAKNKGEHNA